MVAHNRGLGNMDKIPIIPTIICSMVMCTALVAITTTGGTEPVVHEMSSDKAEFTQWRHPAAHILNMIKHGQTEAFVQHAQLEASRLHAEAARHPVRESEEQRQSQKMGRVQSTGAQGKRAVAVGETQHAPSIMARIKYQLAKDQQELSSDATTQQQHHNQDRVRALRQHALKAMKRIKALKSEREALEKAEDQRTQLHHLHEVQDQTNSITDATLSTTQHRSASESSHAKDRFMMLPIQEDTASQKVEDDLLAVEQTNQRAEAEFKTAEQIHPIRALELINTAATELEVDYSNDRLEYDMDTVAI